MEMKNEIILHICILLITAQNYSITTYSGTLKVDMYQRRVILAS